jgi:hypothetical protein
VVRETWLVIVGGLVACSGGPVDTIREPPVERDAGSRDAGATEACEAPREMCGAACADLATDPVHCGGCDNACEAGDACILGGCTAPFLPVQRYTIDDGGLDCDTQIPFWSQRFAVDRDQRIYLGLVCDGEGYMATSTDRGESFQLHPMGLRNVQGFEIIATDNGEAHVAAVTGEPLQGVLVYQRTTDGGETWSPPRPVDLGPVNNAPFGYSGAFAVDGDDVYMSSQWVSDMETVRFWRAGQRGGEPFVLTSTFAVDRTQVWEPELVPDDDGLLFVWTDDRNLPTRTETIMRSDDRAVSFAMVEQRAMVGSAERRKLGDRIFYASPGGGIGYYDLGGDVSGYADSGAIDIRSNGGLTVFDDGRAFTVMHDGEPWNSMTSQFTERLYQYDADADAVTEVMPIADTLDFVSAGRLYPGAYSNTHLFAVPGTGALLMAYARDGAVHFEVLVP